jgi:fatty-acyl-CoA synthase
MADDAVPDFPSMRRFLAKNLAKFMIPEYWVVVPNLPKTSVGKIDKKRLRQQVEAGSLPYVREVGMG